MTRRRLQVLWRVLVATVAVTAVAVVAVSVLPEDLRVWPACVAMVALGVAGVLVLRRRPRPRSDGWLSPRDEADLAAVRAGEPIAWVGRRDVALERARGRVWSGLLSVPMWASQALLWGSYTWSPVWLRAGVLPLVVVGTAWQLHRAGQRIAAIDHYEDTCAAAETSCAGS